MAFFERLSRQNTLKSIEQKLLSKATTLEAEIAMRELYFRISVVGGCNLHCAFCHNEGGPKKGALNIEVAEKAIKDAVAVGFRRVQFTGGEPLLRKDIHDFVAMARTYVDDVGITTNGTHLNRSIDALVRSRISRIHISLQTETLIEAGSKTRWGMPSWLASTIAAANEKLFSLRLNLPVMAHCLELAEQFLDDMAKHHFDVKVFSVLPEGEYKDDEYPLKDLEDLVVRVNERRELMKLQSRVFLRGFRPPQGIRCSSCLDFHRCKEQSHSLRLGADLMLRPCLASRAWDTPLNVASSPANIRESALLAIDY